MLLLHLVLGSLSLLEPRVELQDEPPPKREERSSVGLKPLIEMSADDRYKGEDGGLYGGGKNDPPEGHQAAARVALRRIAPLDAQGKPSKEGAIVLLSVGMSNTFGEFRMFQERAEKNPKKAREVVLVNGAVGGAGAASWARGAERVWSTVADRLKEAHVTPEQVQVAWMKHADPGPDPDSQLLAYAKNLKDWEISILHLLKSKFPNLQVCFLSSRIYGGYNIAGIRLINPEPFAYESAFSVRWVIQDQIRGEPSMNFDPAKGPVRAPVVLWGPYLWADGIRPRKADGLVWERKDLGEDGVHPPAREDRRWRRCSYLSSRTIPGRPPGSPNPESPPRIPSNFVGTVAISCHVSGRFSAAVLSLPSPSAPASARAR